MSNEIRTWLSGLLSALIGGTASTVGLSVTDPSTFNLSKAGLQHLETVAVVGAIIALAGYLTKSPLPYQCDCNSAKK